MFVYAVGRPAYILNAPVFNSAGIGMNSTAHSTHVAHHAKGKSYSSYVKSSSDDNYEWLQDTRSINRRSKG
jgi:hypothetical protein